MSEEGYVFLILFFILLALFIVGIYFYFKKSAELIDPSRCPIVQGNYGVQPLKSGTSVFRCGTNGTSECSFTVRSLNEAITTCNNYLNICQGFSYSPSTQNMRFINNSALADSTIYDTYRLQFHVN